MIDRKHKLSVVRQAGLLGISRGAQRGSRNARTPTLD